MLDFSFHPISSGTSESKTVPRTDMAEFVMMVLRPAPVKSWVSCRTPR